MCIENERLLAFPLQSIKIQKNSMKWGIYLIGVVNLASSIGHTWVLTATNYFTHWTEAIALKKANESIALNFYEDIICRFGVLDSIILDNALAFTGLRISN